MHARLGQFAVAYGLLAVASTSVAVVWGTGSPFLHPDPWLHLTGHTRHLYSAAVGLAFGALVVVMTRMMVERLSWARALHQELRPVATSMSFAGIAVLSVMSALGEELLFRGLLQPWIGLVPQALVFGLAHQLPGPSRWVWAIWATVAGLGLGAMFSVTGSLAGPLAAHALINGLNLAYLRRHDPAPRRRALGGLLGTRG